MKAEKKQLEGALQDALTRGQQNQQGGKRAADALEEIEVLRAELEANQGVLKGHKELLTKTREANRSLRKYKGQFQYTNTDHIFCYLLYALVETIFIYEIRPTYL